MNQPLIGWANRHHDVFLFGRFAAVGERMMYSPQGHCYTGWQGLRWVRRSPPHHFVNITLTWRYP